MKNFYEILGISKTATIEEINEAFTNKADAIISEIRKREKKGENVDDLKAKYRELQVAFNTLSDPEKRKAYDEKLKKQEMIPVNGTGAGAAAGTRVVEEEEAEETAKKGNKFIAGFAVGALAAAIILASLLGAYHLGKNSNDTSITKGGALTGVEQTQIAEENGLTAAEGTFGDTQENQGSKQEQYAAYNYGDIMDDELVAKRAEVLVGELNEAGIVNPTTVAPYTKEEVFNLIKYANGVYTPSTMEEIDLLQLDLLNILISQLNTDPYLFHVVYATGDDSVESLLETPKTVHFADAFTKYGQNGIYPLISWLEEKTNAIYATKDRTEIAAIRDEVLQAVADVMKGNGCTIYIDKNEYHFTSEQILSDPASAMLFTIYPQLVAANNYEGSNELGESWSSKKEWKVFNKFNTSGVDENGQPVYEYDVVPLEEMEIWLNNGCDEQWLIDDAVLLDGKTMGQMVQQTLEGMAQNNLQMSQGSLTLK